MNAEQMVQLSRQILVAVVEGQQARWNEQRTLIVTDYFLRVESHLRGKTADRVTLTMPGGTLDGETHDTSVSVHLRQGERYLLFCRDLEQPQMSPITGSRQGTFREVLRANGTRGVEPALGGEIKVAFADFVDAVRDLVRKTPSGVPVIPGWSRTPNNLPAQVYSPLASAPDGPIDIPQSLLLPGAVPPYPDDASQLVMKLQAAGAAREPDTLTGRYVYLRRPIPPVVFNPLPSNFTPWSPNDQAMMAYWNVYASSLFRVYQPSRGTWAWGDGVSDIAGFPSDAAMVSQFGNAWGPNILGVTYARAGGNGLLIEADIALNPHFAWTTDEADASTAASPANSYRQTMLHELGHAWGLQHPWETQRVWWDSVMNYAPKPFRTVKLFSDDAGAVRAAYPGTQIHDGLLSAHQTDFGSGNHPEYFASLPTSAVVAAGASFQFNQPITLENVGTDDLVNPKVEVYLTPQRISFDNAIFLTTLQYTGAVHPFPNGSVQPLNLPALTV
ncbi:MAG TPA: hypothetical protein VFR31_09665, partial [Thermoanaerobaculia bacterium]|nr:hypothetical protein [Thermoanaerobaculia bacterium]